MARGAFRYKKERQGLTSAAHKLRKFISHLYHIDCSHELVE